MVVDLSNGVAVILDIAVWGIWSALAGYVAHRRPAAAFSDDSWLYRTRPWERDGHAYERVGIKRWKDKLPEAGALFTGGFSKRSVRTRNREVLERFVIETRRAEWTHWTIMLATPVFIVWNWWWVEIAMVAYALAANLPCLLVQRYNRARLTRLLRSQ